MKGEPGRNRGKGKGPGSQGGAFVPCRICGQPTKYLGGEASPLIGMVRCEAASCIEASRALKNERIGATQAAMRASGKWVTPKDNWRRSSQVSPEEDDLLPLISPHGWIAQHVIQTGRNRGARYYKLDFAHLEAKLCVEIDGASHRLPGRAERDAKKDAYLIARGWRVLRFTARDVRKDLEGVARQIVAF